MIKNKYIEWEEGLDWLRPECEFCKHYSENPCECQYGEGNCIYKEKE